MKKNYKKIFDIIKLFLLILIVVIIPIIIYFLFPQIKPYFNDAALLEAKLAELRETGFIVFILLQIVQVIISVIPGEVVQISGGYVYGIFLGSVLTVIGILIGSFCSFNLARLMGKNALYAIFGKKKLDTFNSHLSEKKGRIALFVIFLIPGIPKDLIVYAAGISEIRQSDFYFISMLGRLPAIICSSIMGYLLYSKDYIPLIILAGIATLLFILGMIFRKQIISFLDRIFNIKK